MAPIDPHGRRINYLRLSITDRCNLRCQYCMPEAGVPKLEHADVLSYEELERLAAAAISLGIEKIRVTGGEPLVRKGVVDFLGRLHRLPGLRHLVLTTNGTLLPELAAGLRAAGVNSLNISLDSLDPSTFRQLTRGGDLSQVLAGIDAAVAEELPVKLNVVAMRGVNDHEIPALVDFARNRRLQAVRFIEYMPVHRPANWRGLVVPGDQVLAALGGRLALTAVARSPHAGPAQIFQIAGEATRIGLISPVFGHICGDCNRIRVTATGRARGCLFSDQDAELRPLLGSGNEAALAELLARVIGGKPGQHGLGTDDDLRPFAMSQIGG